MNIKILKSIIQRREWLLAIVIISCENINLTVLPTFSYNQVVYSEYGSTGYSYKPVWIKKPSGIVYSLQKPENSQLIGLRIDSVSGIISIPAILPHASETWTVKASTNGAEYIALVGIHIEPKWIIINSLTYSPSEINFTTGTPLKLDSPIISTKEWSNVNAEKLPKDVSTEYSIKPALPKGIQIDSETGAITSELPLTDATPVVYTVTLILSGNYKGSKTTNVTISVGDLDEPLN